MNVETKKKIKVALKKSFKQIIMNLSSIFAIVGTISILRVMFLNDNFSKLFNKGIFDPLIGASLGSVFAGNPVTSYVLSGELLKQGVSLITITAFIIAWVTVGIVQLPTEMKMLGKKFSLLRNILAFIFAIVIAVLTNYFMTI